MKKYLFPLLLLMAFNCLGQNIITGRVISKTGKKPVSNAVVFLNNSGIETATDSSGQFTLKNVPHGEYQLLVTIVGYENYKTPIAVSGNGTLSDIVLTPKNEVLNDVVIKAKPKLSPCYYVFITEFLGNSPFARECKIMNPYAIQFFDIDPQGGFSARSGNFIEIDNDALGYKIKFLLNYFNKDVSASRTFFSGESYFEEMKGTLAQQQEWNKNRLECYQGSMMHLLRAIMSDSIKQNGFRIKRAHREDNAFFNRNGLEVDPYDIDNSIDFFGNSDNVRYNDKLSDDVLQGRNILLTTSDAGLFAIAGNKGNNNSLYIEHTDNTIPVAGGKPIHVPWIWHAKVSFITFDKPYLIFDHNGKVLTPRNVHYTGFFTEQTRVATLLPFDYRPVQ
jgi:hypothetical protein